MGMRCERCGSGHVGFFYKPGSKQGGKSSFYYCKKCDGTFVSDYEGDPPRKDEKAYPNERDNAAKRIAPNAGSPRLMGGFFFLAGLMLLYLAASLGSGFEWFLFGVPALFFLWMGVVGLSK